MTAATPFRYDKPGELAAIRKRPLGVIEASAGTGKTFVLEHLVVDLVIDGIPLDQILVVTFTEKATAELARRIRDKLQHILACAAQPAAATLVKSDGGDHWLIDARALGRIRQALLDIDKATIATIHGFCQRVLGEHAFASGRLLNQQIVDGRTAFAAAFRDALRHDLAALPEPRAYLEAWLGNGGRLDRLESVLYTAGGFVRHGLPVGPAFDEAALRAAAAAFSSMPWQTELWKVGLSRASKGRSAKALFERLEDLRRLCGSLIASGDVAAYLGRLEAADAGRSEGIFGYIRSRFWDLPPTLTKLDELLAAYRELDQASVPLAAAMVARFLPPVLARLDSVKRETGTADFDDLLRAVDEALTGPAGPALVADLRGRYRAALIDEFQDTDEVQWRIFRRLFVEPGQAGSLYVIGDPKQAIYGWRGADVHAYLDARREIGVAGGASVTLQRNFRSTAALVDACNEIFAPTGTAAFFRGNIGYERPVEPGLPGMRAVDADGRPLPPVRLLSVMPIDNQPMRAGAMRTALAGHMAREISDLCARPGRIEGVPPTRPLCARDIFVLTRTVREGYEIGAALRAVGVPHAYFKQDGLFRSDEAAAVSDLLAAIEEPGDRAKRLRAFLTPFFGLSLAEVALLPDSAAEAALSDRLRGWQALAEAREWERLFAVIIEDSGLSRRQLFFGESERLVTNVRHLFEILLHEAVSARLGVRELLLALNAYRAAKRLPEGDDPDVQRLETDRDAVQIMTMHKAKGLEAAYVFVYGGFFRFLGASPVRVHHAHGHREAWVGKPRDAALVECMKREQAEEDERLLYVALTRAKAQLVLPYFGTLGEGDNSLDAKDVIDTEVVKRLDGCYGLLNRRLRALLADESFSAHHELVTIPCGADAAATDADVAPLARSSAARSATLAWAPPRELLAADPGGDIEAASRTRRRACVGPVVTSYSQLKRLADAQAARGESGRDDEGDDSDDGVAAPSIPDELPGGAATGIFLHELLEQVPLATFAGHPAIALERWLSVPDVRAFFDRRCAERDLDAGARRACERIVHGALTTPLSGDGRTVLPSLSALPRAALREAEILYPLPGGERTGFVRGILDVLFEHDGVVYGVDWKSDIVTGDGGDLADLHARFGRHVDQHYDLQIRLYTLGVLRFLDVSDPAAYEARFGGLCYFFLRGRQVLWRRPAWDEVVAWQDDLRHDPRVRALREI